MKGHLQEAILKGYLGLSTRLKTSSLDFPFSWHVFFIGFNNNTISFLFPCPSCEFRQNNGKKKELIFFSTGTPPWYIVVAISLRWLVLVIGLNNNSINTVSFFHLLPFLCDFHQKWPKKRIAIFSTGHPSWKVVEELQRAVAANPEEVAVGTDPNID